MFAINATNNNKDEVEHWTRLVRETRRQVEVGAPDAQQRALDCHARVQRDVVSRQQALTCVHERCERALQQRVREACELAEHLAGAVHALRLQERRIGVRRESLARDLRASVAREQRCRNAVVRLEEQRRTALNAIAHPTWERSHHFHMTAVEHFRGNKQRHLVEVAALFPGHLRVLAMARCTASQPLRLVPAFTAAQEARQDHALGVGALDAERLQKRAETERLEDLQRRLGRRLHDHDHGRGQGRLQLYHAIKSRYFAALKLDDAVDAPDADLDLDGWEQRVDDALQQLDDAQIDRKNASEALQRVVDARRRLEHELVLLRTKASALSSVSLPSSPTSSSRFLESRRSPSIMAFC